MNNRALEEVQKLIYTNKRLLELCVYALIRDTPIYIHELETLTKLKIMDIIMENLDDDTATLQEKLLMEWDMRQKWLKEKLEEERNDKL